MDRWRGRRAWLGLLMVSVAALAAEDAPPAWQPLGPLNRLGLGTWTGQLQSLTHARDFNRFGGEEPSGSSSTLALTLNYVSPEYYGLSLGGQYIHSEALFAHNPDVPINNSFHLLNHAYVNYRFVDLGLPRTNLRAGRMKPDFLMMNGLAPRQKEQAFEGAMRAWRTSRTSRSAWAGSASSAAGAPATRTAPTTSGSTTGSPTSPTWQAAPTRPQAPTSPTWSTPASTASDSTSVTGTPRTS